MHQAYPILYSFRRCPYAMRARLALFTSNVVCELREVVLRDKPAALIDLSPKATVPVLHHPNGAVVDESLDIMLWALEQHDPQGWKKPDMSEMLKLIKRNDQSFKHHLDRYKYPDRYENTDPLQHRMLAQSILQHLEQQLQNTPYLLGNAPCLADFAILPFIRQFAFVDKAWFDSTPYTALQHWLATFLESPLFTAIMQKYAQWHEDDSPVYLPTLPKK
ncbi:glutathione S-transferase [Magnetococcus sp. PR-3]|uniref:glutathione S-transferase n=1 Tax=Magnetococcus sp. PR-3 TaxID=3120355 RepID=UPI002FCDF758